MCMKREVPFLTIRDVSAWLQVKPGTLYAWVSQGKIPHVKIHGLVRFQAEEIQEWLRSFCAQPLQRLHQEEKRSRGGSHLEAIIVRAKEDVYNSWHGETRRRSSPIGKEAADGAV